MIHFPSTARVGRTIPKEAFYKQLKLSAELKDKFVTDVRRITVEYSFSPSSINVDPSEEVTEIIVLGVQLKKRDFDCRIVESIARQNPHKLLFLLSFENDIQMALLQGKLYKTDWAEAANASLSMSGHNLQEVWQGFIEQIALTNETAQVMGLSIEERLKRQEEIAKLKKEIGRLEKLARAEKQPKKKFELAQAIIKLKMEL